MAEETQRAIGQFVIKEAKLTNYNKREYNILGMKQGFNLYEDINSATMSGDILIVDGIDMIHDFPIIGEETLSLKFELFQGKKNIDLKFRVYRIGERTLLQEKLQAYTLYFASEEHFTAMGVKIKHSFNGKKYSEAVQTIFDEYLGSSKKIEIEDTKNIHKFIIANKNPFQAMEFIANRSVSPEDAANYHFYETKEGFNFVSLDKLAGEDEVEEYSFGFKNIDDDKVDLERQHKGVIEWNLDSQFDIIKNQLTGMYANKVIAHDIVNQSFEEIEYKYSDEFSKATHLEKGPLASGKDKNMDLTDAMIKLFPAQIGHDGDKSHIAKLEPNIKPNKVEEWMGHRVSSMMQWDAVKINVTLAGDSKLKVGDVVKFTVPTQGIPETQRDKIDRHWSGKYLITAIKHSVSNEGYFMVMEWTKDSFFNPVQDKGLS